jgi:hypothetical protein
MTLMLTEFIGVIISIAVWWCGLFAVLSGLGLLGCRAFGLPVQSAEAWLLSFWSGWVFAILILQLWHLWLKIDIWAFAAILALGTRGLLWNRRELWHLMRACLLRHSWLTIILLVMALWIANRAIGPIRYGDTGLYHMAAVKWAASYPIVPGLGNLHERLAFNSSFFLYAAMLEVGPWEQKAHYLANGLFLLVLLAQIFLSLQKIILGDHKYRSYHLFNVLLLAPTFGVMFKPDFSSFTPDIIVFILGVVLACRVYYLFTNYGNDFRDEYYNVFLIVLLCTVGVTMKLSFVPLGVSTLIVVLVSWYRKTLYYNEKEKKKLLFWILIFNVSLAGVWVVRSVILSGYLVFPYSLGSLPLSWRVPRPLALSVTNWIHSWARAPGVFWTEVLDNWNWLRPWLKNFPAEYIKPLIAGLPAIILYLVTRLRIIRRAPQENHIYLSILAPPFIAVIFWFFSVPEPRFSGACFWIFGAGFAALAIDNIDLQRSKTIRILELLLSLSFFVYLFPPYDSLFIVPNQEGGPFYNIPKAEYITVSINNLAKLNLPTKDGQCWNISVPCTPYYRPTLRLRNNDLRSGFMLDDTFTFADMHIGSPPRGLIVSRGIGAIVIDNTWYTFEQGENFRWMHIPGKILVYTEHATYVKISFKPFMINVNGIMRNEEQLKVSLNNLSGTELSFKSGMITEAVLWLRPDFNIIALDLASGSGKPNEPYVGNADTQPISVAFYSIELESVVLLK